MKKNVVIRVAAIVVMCALVTACFASSTFAKYTSSTTGTASATVAKWSIQYDGTEFAVTGTAPTVTVDLFKTINGHAAGDTVTKLAPGTSGQFDFKDVKNSSEVDATVAITASITNNSSVPLQWSTDGKTYSSTFPTTVVSATTVKAGESLTGKTLYWKWAFDGDDTALGIAAQTAAPEVSVSLTITATQVD